MCACVEFKGTTALRFCSFSGMALSLAFPPSLDNGGEEDWAFEAGNRKQEMELSKSNAATAAAPEKGSGREPIACEPDKSPVGA